MRRSNPFLDLNQAVSLSAGHDRMIVFARRESGELAHVDEVENGRACRCCCLACNETLIARHGDVRGHSFAHRSGTQCAHASEALLHAVAMELIGRYGFLVTPALQVEASVAGPYGRLIGTRRIAATKVAVDSVTLDRLEPWSRPSVVASVKGRRLLVHIAVRHRADEAKRQALAAIDQAAIEIDLTQQSPGTVAELGRILFQADSRKSWLFNQRREALRREVEVAIAAEAAEQRRQHQVAISAREAQRDLERAAYACRRVAEQQLALAAVQQRLAAAATQPARTALAQPAPKPIKPAEMSPSVEYDSPQGRLWLLHSSMPDIHFKVEPGVEHALRTLRAYGAVGYDADIYRISRDGWSAAAVELAGCWTAVRSVTSASEPISGQVPGGVGQ